MFDIYNQQIQYNWTNRKTKAEIRNKFCIFSIYLSYISLQTIILQKVLEHMLAQYSFFNFSYQVHYVHWYFL